jgi:hypothetical protein
MAKRSDFKKNKLDFYQTPIEAVTPLISHLPNGAKFCEPCAGEGRLIDHLQSFGLECVSAYDVSPERDDILRHDATFITKDDIDGADIIITNPPWGRHVLHQIIERCASLAPTWLLFDADWMHTFQSKHHMQICHKIVSIGRVKWFAGSKNKGMDSCCWYLFDAQKSKTHIEFIGR